MKALLLALLLISTDAIADQWIMNTNLNLTGQESGLNYFWNFYNGGDALNGAYIGWMSYDGSSRTNIIADVNLGTTNAAGTYYLFLKTLEYEYKSNAIVTMGSVTLTTPQFEDHDYNGRWSGPYTFASATAFTNVTINFAKPGGNATNIQRLLFEGLFITTNAFLDTADGTDRFITFRMPATTNSAANYLGNQLEDASFESWPSHGWGFEASDSNQEFGQSFLVHTSAVNVIHGARSLHVTDGGNVYSRIFRMRGDRLVSLSLWAKSTNAQTRLTVTLAPFITVPTNKVAVTNLVISTGTITTNGWVRYSTNGVVWNYPAPYYQLTIACGQGDHPETPTDVFLDAVQIEEGALTAFSTKFQGEFGLHTTNTGNIFHAAPVIQIDAFNNSSASAAKTLTFEVFDIRNRVATNGTFAFTCGVSNVTTTSLTLGSLTNGGAYRMVGWTDGNAGYRDELLFSVVPVAVMSTNYTLGTHPNFVPFHAQLLTAAGIKFARGLSPGSVFRWATLEPTEGNFVWIDDKVAMMATNGIEILASMCTNYEWPSFANIGDNTGVGVTNTFSLPKYSNWVYAVVNRYKSSIHYWEFWNEPHYAFTTNFMALMHSNFVAATKNADANARICGFGGQYVWETATNTWALIDSSVRANIDYLSFHSYPFDLGPNKPDSEIRLKDYAYTFLVSGKELWQTETGEDDTGFGFTENSGFAPVGAYYLEYQSSYRYGEPVFSTEEGLVNYLRSIGMRFTKYFHYDFRIRANPSYQRTEFTALEFTDSLRPKLITRALANQLIANGRGTGWITNDANSFVEAYVITNATSTIVSLWSNDRTNRFLTVTNTGFLMLDEMCNPVTVTNSRVYLGRKPSFLVTTTLTTAQLSNTVKFATSTNVADTLAPYVSIDLSPNGTISATNYPLCFKWQGIDDTTLFTNSYAYKLVGVDAAFSSWTQSNYVEYASVPAGTFSLQVKARDGAGNESAAVSGPSFTSGVASGGTTLNVINLNVGTLVVP